MTKEEFESLLKDLLTHVDFINSQVKMIEDKLKGLLERTQKKSNE